MNKELERVLVSSPLSPWLVLFGWNTGPNNICYHIGFSTESHCFMIYDLPSAVFFCLQNFVCFFGQRDLMGYSQRQLHLLGLTFVKYYDLEIEFSNLFLTTYLILVAVSTCYYQIVMLAADIIIAKNDADTRWGTRL